VLEQVEVDAVAALPGVVGPHVALGEADQVQRLLGQAVGAVRPRLRVRERGVGPLDGAGVTPADLEPDVERGRLATLPGVEPLDGVTLSLAGVRALGQTWDVASSPSAITVEASA